VSQLLDGSEGSSSDSEEAAAVALLLSQRSGKLVLLSWQVSEAVPDLARAQLKKQLLDFLLQAPAAA
jgi:hypothetical protein